MFSVGQIRHRGYISHNKYTNFFVYMLEKKLFLRIFAK